MRDMGKELRVSCDVCGRTIAEKNYAVLTIRKMLNGQITKAPSLYLCPKCFDRTKQTLVLTNFAEEERE